MVVLCWVDFCLIIVLKIKKGSTSKNSVSPLNIYVNKKLIQFIGSAKSVE